MKLNNNPSPRLSTAELLAEMGWVQSLARRLVKDQAGADDLAQEALLSALQSNARPKSLRHWLAGMLRNLNRNRSRADQGRKQRERSSARAELVPSVTDVLERAALQRDLVGLVLELEEPYRTSVLLRFFEELPLAEIGRRMQVPASTVGTRIERGLRRLQARYERENPGGRAAWLAFLLPLSRTPAGSQLAGPLAAGGVASISVPGSLPLFMLMSVQAKVLLSAAALLGAVFLWRGMRSQERAPLQGSLVQRAVLEDSLLALPMQEQEVALPGPESMVGERVAAPPVSASSVPSAAQAASEIKSLKGRVIDMQGRGVEGLQVVLRAFTHRRGAKGPRGEHDPHGIAAPAPGPIARPASNSVLSASNGAFELEVEGPAWVEVASESHTTLMSSFGSPGDTDLIVVVAACMRLGGQVVDRGTGEPLERARLMLINGELAFSELGLNEEQTSRASISTETGADGRFVLSNAAYVKNSFLVAQCAGYVDLVQPLPTEASVELRFELVARSGPDVIRGLVRLPDGRPAEGALVACGGFAVEADAAGRFTLQASQAPEGRVDPTQAIVVHGVLAGFGPALRELPPLEGASSEPWPEEIVLQLSKERSGLRGHVRDQNGKGLQGILVGIQRPTDFGLVRDGDSLTSSTLRSVEDLLNPGLDDLRTDADGAFEIHNLMQRSYELEAFDPGSGCVSASLAYPAGTSGIDLRLDTSLVGRLAGHVVTRAGSPVAGIRMVLVRAQKGRNFRMGQSCVTDEEGRFALQGAALEEVGLSISGPTVQFEIFRALPEGQDREQLEIVVSLRCHAQFEWESWSTQGARLSIVGAGDLPVELSTRTAEYISVQADAPIYGALSPVFVLPDSASAAVIKLDGLEIGRVPLKLVPGDVQRVKL